MLAVRQPAGIEQMDLVDVRDVYQREQLSDGDLGAGFLPCFARCGVGGCFVVFHETRRQRPKPEAWLDGAPTQQNPAVPLRDAADDHLGILIVDGAALRADMAGQGIAGRNQARDGAATLAAEMDGWMNAAHARQSTAEGPWSLPVERDDCIGRKGI